MKIKKLICTACESKFDADLFEINGREITFQTMCEPCLEKTIAREAQDKAAIAHKSRRNDFWVMFPPMYQQTDESRLNARLSTAINSYSYGSQGLGFAGESGAGKTRSMVVLMEKLNQQGKSVMFLKATRLTEVAYQRFDDDHKIKSMAKAAIDHSKIASCLLLDDLGKGRLPQSAEELLFDIIDTRIEMGLPLFWTSNAKAEQLHSTFSPDRADPIIRRLAEFTSIITI